MSVLVRYLKSTLSAPPALIGLVRRHRQLIAVLVRRDISLRTTDTAIGWVWLLLQPALQVLAFWFLFGVVLQIRFPGKVPFVEYLLSGLVLWLMISEILNHSLSVLGEYSALYQRSQFPLPLLPLMPLIVSGGILGTVYSLTMALAGGWWAGLMAAVVVILVLLWLIPLCYLMAVMGLFLKDLGKIIPFVLTMTLYLTPILYAPEMLPDWLHFVLYVNPFADIMVVAHGLIQGTDITLWNLFRIIVWWFLLLTPSWVLYNRLVPHMREAL